MSWENVPCEPFPPSAHFQLGGSGFIWVFTCFFFYMFSFGYVYFTSDFFVGYVYFTSEHENLEVQLATIPTAN
jgi:hypothetical protein